MRFISFDLEENSPLCSPARCGDSPPWLLMCARSFQDAWNFLLQTSQTCDRAPAAGSECAARWSLSFIFEQKDFWQTSHVCDVLTLWIIMWELSTQFSVNALWQILHSYGFSPVCRATCPFRPLVEMKNFPQMWQPWVVWWLWRWSLSSSADSEHSPQTPQSRAGSSTWPQACLITMLTDRRTAPQTLHNWITSPAAVTAHGDDAREDAALDDDAREEEAREDEGRGEEALGDDAREDDAREEEALGDEARGDTRIRLLFISGLIVWIGASVSSPTLFSSDSFHFCLVSNLDLPWLSRLLPSRSQKRGRTTDPATCSRFPLCQCPRLLVLVTLSCWTERCSCCQDTNETVRTLWRNESHTDSMFLMTHRSLVCSAASTSPCRTRDVSLLDGASSGAWVEKMF